LGKRKACLRSSSTGVVEGSLRCVPSFSCFMIRV
jgi:hypothetical protein